MHTTSALSATATAAAALALAGSASAFDAESKTNVATYWGQGPNQARLIETCKNPSIDIVNLAFVNVFPDQGAQGWPGTNFGNACDGNTYTYKNGSTELLSGCTYIGQDIQDCQTVYGKKVLLSLGGGYPANNYLKNDTTAINFANFLWGSFGPYIEEDLGNGSYSAWEAAGGPRPFGQASVDGFDFDIETIDLSPTPVDDNGDAITDYKSRGYATMIDHLKNSLFTQDLSKDYYISGAPQCVVPDAHLSDAITSSWFDFLFVQFYNTPQCSARAGYNALTANATTTKRDDGGFTFNEWTQQASLNPDVKVYLGLPASEDAAGDPSFYLTPQEVTTVVADIYNNTKFGGIMVWEATYSANNVIDGVDYAGNMKKLLEYFEESQEPQPSNSTSSAAPSGTGAVSSSYPSGSSIPFPVNATSSEVPYPFSTDVSASYVPLPTVSSYLPANGSMTATDSVPVISPVYTVATSYAAEPTTPIVSYPAQNGTALPSHASGSSSVASASSGSVSATAGPVSGSSSSAVTSSKSASGSVTSSPSSTTSATSTLATCAAPTLCPGCDGLGFEAGNELFVLACNTGCSGTVIQTVPALKFGKRDAEPDFQSCIQECSNTEGCVAVSYETTALECTMYSSVDGAYGEAGVQFAYVQGLDVTYSNNATTSATGVASGTPSGVVSGSTSVSGPITAAPVNTAAPSQTTIVEYSTTVETIISCAATVTNCPAHPEQQTTSLLTTSVPVGTAVLPLSTSTVYSTTVETIISCAATVTNCPAHPEQQTTSLVTKSAAVATSVVPMTTSTVYTTTLRTITSCAATVTDCPARSGKPATVTDVIALYTTYCPYAGMTQQPTQASSAYPVGPVQSSPAQPAPAQSTPVTQTIYTTDLITVTKCAATVTNCPANQKTTQVLTSTYAVSTTIINVCPGCAVSTAPASSVPAGSAPAASAPAASAPACSGPGCPGASASTAPAAPASSAAACSGYGCPPVIVASSVETMTYATTVSEASTTMVEYSTAYSTMQVTRTVQLAFASPAAEVTQATPATEAAPVTIATIATQAIPATEATVALTTMTIVPIASGAAAATGSVSVAGAYMANGTCPGCGAAATPSVEAFTGAAVHVKAGMGLIAVALGAAFLL